MELNENLNNQESETTNNENNNTETNTPEFEIVRSENTEITEIENIKKPQKLAAHQQATRIS